MPHSALAFGPENWESVAGKCVSIFAAKRYQPMVQATQPAAIATASQANFRDDGDDLSVVSSYAVPGHAGVGAREE